MADRHASKDDDSRQGPSGEGPPEPEAPVPADTATRPVEIGGRPGPDPTRYGDWEKGGRCIDF